jgi:hypothetical protein
MPAVLGLRGTGDFSSDERPKNWRELLLYLFPNGQAPLTALLSMMPSEGTDSPEFNWWEKRLPTQRLRVNNVAHIAAGGTTIVVDSGAKDCVKGTLLLVEGTEVGTTADNEILYVSVDPTTDTSLTVTRSWGTVPANAINDNEFLTIIGNVNEEGASTPTAKAYAPTKLTNFTQIFRMPLYLTRTARRERLRWDSTGPYREAKREALSLHSIEMEKAFLFGDAVESTGSLGKPMRSTKGITNFITTNKGTAVFDVAGTLTEAELDIIMEAVFRYGSSEKLALCGSTFMRAITGIAKAGSNINRVPTDTTYGMGIYEYLSPSGNLMLKSHPLFNQHDEWRKNALIIDTKNIKYRPLDDTMFIKNRQNNGEDASKDEFLTECGLEVWYEETHAYITGVTGNA